jgi:hypothetical protein
MHLELASKPALATRRLHRTLAPGPHPRCPPVTPHASPRCPGPLILLVLRSDGCVTYKRPPVGPLVCARASPGFPRKTIRHRAPLAMLLANYPAAQSSGLVTSPKPRLDLVEAQTIACCSAVPRASPERAPQRPPPGKLSRAASIPSPATNRAVVSSPTFVTPFPAKNPVGANEFQRARPPPWKGPNCIDFNLSRVFCENQGHMCEC